MFGFFLSGIMALDASYFVSKALQNSLSWTSLAMILKDLAPTLDEAIAIIGILLNELESLQSSLQNKDKVLEEYQNKNELLIDKTEEDKSTLESETETIEDDNEILDNWPNHVV